MKKKTNNTSNKQNTPQDLFPKTFATLSKEITKLEKSMRKQLKAELKEKYQK